MKTSAECRWFWRTTAVAALGQWFIDGDGHECTARGGDPEPMRIWPMTSQEEPGIKHRGTGRGVEIKGLVSVLDSGCQKAPFHGPIELWTKWFSDALTLHGIPLIWVRKRRWLRQFDTTGAEVREVTLNARQPDQGCTVEYTELSTDGSPTWVPLGFEAFGPMESLARSVRRTATLLAARKPPEVESGWLASYPVWLRQWSGANSDRKTA